MQHFFSLSRSFSSLLFLPRPRRAALVASRGRTASRLRHSPHAGTRRSSRAPRRYYHKSARGTRLSQLRSALMTAAARAPFPIPLAAAPQCHASHCAAPQRHWQCVQLRGGGRGAGGRGNGRERAQQPGWRGVTNRARVPRSRRRNDPPPSSPIRPELPYGRR